MSIHKIVRWDASLGDCTIIPKPFIYFSPDLETLEFLKRNDYRAIVQINNTGSQSYDGLKTWGVAKKSTFAAGCRPNFYAATELWVITLDTYWNGYPKQLGSFEFIKGPITPPSLRPSPTARSPPIPQPKKSPKQIIRSKPSQNFAEELPTKNVSKNKGLQTSQIIGIILAIIVFVLFAFFIGYLVNKKN